MTLEAVRAIRGRLREEPRVLLVLGSGLSSLAAEVENPVEIPFSDVPGFPGEVVAGHGGRFVAGRLGGRAVLVQAGRFHLYEGYPPETVVAPIRVAAALGVRTVVLTNAAGGVNRHLGPGSLMLIDDHMNMLWRSPLAGPVRDGEERFPDMSAPYDPALQALAVEVALELGIPLARGTYVAVLGPSYETPAEIRMIERMGGDAVGMSTVPEVIAARARGLRVLAFSLITNPAAGRSLAPLDHREVLEVGRAAGGTLGRLIAAVVTRMPDPDAAPGGGGGEGTGAPGA